MAARTWDPDVLVAAAGEPKRSVARRLGVDVANLCRPLTDRQADRYAIALGFLPWEVWGMQWLE